jgi:hypothetical protein|tara:strand:+ start:104 stop:559 length:456 start_codon:yes stop_codon:yes gene_type:complete
MAHFAKINNENQVLTVLVMDNNIILDSDNKEDESIGQQYLQTHNNWPANQWIQTSYNTNKNTHSSGDNSKAFRGNYASIGYVWDATNNIFWRPKPYPSWVKNTTTASWDSPIGDAPTLTEEQTSQNEAESHEWIYIWNEDTTAWDLTNTAT